ncbi:MAG: putative metallopeptidase [uncultured Nocardioidaceae bacterium]|uniref:Putative metallopeptidase n=1 Tax=uncultured Nocardioidaceae bacterium TaxID=253824 RepID=A0A6J4M3C2_9ACTN|nr:MAG: putative metallopeptidase [uncultured Nocardioidaceae bacterium]
MGRRASCAAAVLTALALVAPATSPAASSATSPAASPAAWAALADAGRARPGPGAAGVGDRYFPRAGNGGYDVAHYTLDLTYRPGSDRLAGVATVDAEARRDLTRFNLDLSGLRVLSVLVDGRPATWSRRRAELRVRPASVLRRGEFFRTVVTYAGVPRTLRDGSGFLHTRDGSLVMGEPKVAATWFPVNDHPSDKASYTFLIRAPRSRSVVANGELVDTRTIDGWTTWRWEAAEPMAPYLATANVGRWRFSERTHDGIEILDAVDARLFRPFARPRTGDRLAFVPGEDDVYRRLTRSLTVPDDGARVSFFVDRDTEEAFDFFTVEAHTVGADDWTTLPDLKGHTRRFPGGACPRSLEIHPFLEHYLSSQGGEELCRPRGSTGRWHAASGRSRGHERWVVDLSRFAGSRVELSLTTVTDESVTDVGVHVDDIRVSTGEGTTSFEADGDPWDGWRATGPPPGSPAAGTAWSLLSAADIPSRGSLVQRSLDREGEVIDFLESWFGRYPFSQAGGIVDRRRTGFALETQTRPVYDARFFDDPVSGASIVVHELAHQWVGDSATVKRWRHIWLNEGFATYAEWLWSDRTGSASPQEIFDDLYREIGRRNDFWELRIGDPGSRRLFDFAVYYRGAMTLQALRATVGHQDFRTILRRWTQSQSGGLVTTGQFVRLAERVSGRSLHRFFRQWLFTGEKPPRPSGMPAAPARPSAGEVPGDKPAARLTPHQVR